MLVKNWMTRDVIAVDEGASMQDAIAKLKESHIRMLPVLRDGRLAGIVTDRDLKRASASDATTLDIHELLYLVKRIKVKDIMVKKVVSISEDYTVEEAAAVLLQNKISGAPVLADDGRLAGVITQSDLFKVLISLTGMKARGIQFCLQIKDEPGTIKVFADIIRKYQGKVASILTTYDQVPEGFRKVYFRFSGVDRLKLKDLIGEVGEKGRLLYMVDHRENERYFYE